LPDTPPHTPVTASTVPQTKKPSYVVNGAGLPTPPADDDNKLHILPNEFTRGTYGRSESFIVSSPEVHDEDMDTEYDSDDDAMSYTDDYDSDGEVDDIIMVDHHHHPMHKMAPRIVLGPVV
jgi:hypothetical protein